MSTVVDEDETYHLQCHESRGSPHQPDFSLAGVWKIPVQGTEHGHACTYVHICMHDMDYYMHVVTWTYLITWTILTGLQHVPLGIDGICMIT